MRKLEDRRAPPKSTTPHMKMRLNKLPIKKKNKLKKEAEINFKKSLTFIRQKQC